MCFQDNFQCRWRPNHYPFLQVRTPWPGDPRCHRLTLLYPVPSKLGYDFVTPSCILHYPFRRTILSFDSLSLANEVMIIPAAVGSVRLTPMENKALATTAAATMDA